jgi:hypothetical protein
MGRSHAFEKRGDQWQTYIQQAVALLLVDEAMWFIMRRRRKTATTPALANRQRYPSQGYGLIAVPGRILLAALQLV